MWFHKVEFFSSVIYFKVVFNGHPFIILFYFFVLFVVVLFCGAEFTHIYVFTLVMIFHKGHFWTSTSTSMSGHAGIHTVVVFMSVVVLRPCKSTLWFSGLSNACIGYTIYFGYSIHSESKTREIGLNITAEEINILPLRNTVHNIPTLLCWHWSCVLL